MARAGRVGDQAKNPADAHGCSVCAHSVQGPAREGSPDTFINSRAALRVGDPGIHALCCATNTWEAAEGSPTVFINGKAAHRLGDDTKHCGGTGALVEGSPDVCVGDLMIGSPRPMDHGRRITVEVTDGLQRGVQEAIARTTCPHREYADVTFTQKTELTGLCDGASVTVIKTLQRGAWDANAASGQAISASHAIVQPPGAAADAEAPAEDAAPEAAEAPAAAPEEPPPAPAPAKPAAPQPKSGQHVVHAPSPAATPGERSQVTVVRPTTQTARVQLTTVHNWVELLYTAFGHELPKGANEVAILGVREATLKGLGDLKSASDRTKIEAEAATDRPDEVDFGRIERDGTSDVVRKSRKGRPIYDTRYDDLLFFVWTDKKVEHTQRVEVFECTIDPGARGDNPRGDPYLLEGKLYHCKPGTHQTGTYGPGLIAMHVFSAKYPDIVLAREATQKHRTFSQVESAKVLGHWNFVDTEYGNSTIHMHFGSTGGAAPADWSTGCTVLRHSKASARYKRFQEIYGMASNKAKIPYLVVSSEYIELYDDWVKVVDQSPGAKPEPKTVIRKDGLRSIAAKPGKYLPSIMTEGFANGVLALADKLGRDAKAANLRRSLDMALFDLQV